MEAIWEALVIWEAKAIWYAGDLGGFARGHTLASQAKSSQVKPSHGQVKMSTVAGLWYVKQEQPDEKSGGP